MSRSKSKFKNIPADGRMNASTTTSATPCFVLLEKAMESGVKYGLTYSLQNMVSNVWWTIFAMNSYNDYCFFFGTFALSTWSAFFMYVLDIIQRLEKICMLNRTIMSIILILEVTCSKKVFMACRFTYRTQWFLPYGTTSENISEWGHFTTDCNVVQQNIISLKSSWCNDTCDQTPLHVSL